MDSGLYSAFSPVTLPVKSISVPVPLIRSVSVSYTHLDVYKRQAHIDPAHLKEAQDMAEKVTRALTGAGLWGVEMCIRDRCWTWET